MNENALLESREIQQFYADVIDKIHASVGRLLKLAPGSQLFKLADALTALAELKEVQGRQRGLVLAILNQGKASESQIRQLVVLTTKYEFLSQKFLKLAPLQFQEDFIRLGFDNIGDAESQTLRSILESDADAQIKGNADQWFTAVTQRVDGMRELEKSINQELTQYAESSRKKAFNSLLTTIAIALATIGTIVSVALIATKKMAEGFVKLRDSAVEFTESGEFKTVAIHSEDELGEVASAFNRLISQLGQISQAAEAVASGDFTQQMEIKSERDRLALSMNHMVRTLRESVDRMQAENWLKTGQSDLAIQMNADQGLQDLAQRAITYLAEYLKAPVAAVYLVVQDEIAELYASYAYTFRKDARNRFMPGESLIGQAMRERKPIVIDQLPPDYISISSGLGSTAPQNLVVIPLIYANKVLGVLELGCLHTLKEVEMDLLRKGGESLATALHAALSRERLAELLEETQAQAEELQAQQEELEQANSELEEQTQQLEEAQQELQLQKQQLVETNEELRQSSEELANRNSDIQARSTELEKARKALEIKAEELTTASKYKSEFLANMSHELRSPLNSLLLLAQTLKENDEKNLTDGQLEAIKIIYGSGRDLLNLINDILDLSKVEAGKLVIESEACELPEIIGLIYQQFTPLALEKKLDFSVKIDPQAPKKIHTDQQRLQQILRNLLSNAIKFTDAGKVTLSVIPDGEKGVLFQVQDTGIGIPKKLQHAIFEVFQQGDGSIRRKYSGTGLGLTISRELAHLLGGVIELQSEENKGSLFTLRLPLEAVVHEPIMPRSSNDVVLTEAIPLNDNYEFPTPDTEGDIVEFIPDDRHQLQGDKDLLLIIEDDLVFARCMMELAHGRQFQCLVAGDGQSGIQMAKRFKPDAIVLDMMLPDSSGDQIMQQLKADNNTNEIPVHIISSLDKEDVEKGDAIGILTKPISKESIDNAFNHILQRLHADQKRCVLVIEDDRDTRKAIESLLKKQDVEILHAGTGHEGLILLEQEPVGCLILDLHLPDMDSMDILKKVAGENVLEPLPVIIYTGADLSHEEYKLLRQYTNNIIIKGSWAQERLLNDVTLFLHSVGPKTRRLPVPKDDNVLKDKKILIVDDDMRNTFALANLLRRHGVKVVMADNGSLALEKLNESGDINIAIMDIMMPVMDGYEAIRRIRERTDYKNLPIIALTAKAMPEDRDKCLQVGANDYLAKPVDSERLISALRLWASA
nr:response regulator [Cellvibrio sp. KY-GH-1]